MLLFILLSEEALNTFRFSLLNLIQFITIQDRCVQFDSLNNEPVKTVEPHLLGNNMPKIKSNSCENLLEENPNEKSSVESQTETKIKIAISSSSSQPVKRTSSIKRKNSIKRTNSINKTKPEPQSMRLATTNALTTIRISMK